MRADVRSQDRQSERADQSGVQTTGQQGATFNVTELDFGSFMWEPVGADFCCYTSWNFKKKSFTWRNKVREKANPPVSLSHHFIIFAEKLSTGQELFILVEGDDGLRQLSEIQLQERGDGMHVCVAVETEET